MLRFFEPSVKESSRLQRNLFAVLAVLRYFEPTVKQSFRLTTNLILAWVRPAFGHHVCASFRSALPCTLPGDDVPDRRGTRVFLLRVVPIARDGFQGESGRTKKNGI